jgi:hypothetical protein
MNKQQILKVGEYMKINLHDEKNRKQRLLSDLFFWLTGNDEQTAKDCDENEDGYVLQHRNGRKVGMTRSLYRFVYGPFFLKTKINIIMQGLGVLHNNIYFGFKKERSISKTQMTTTQHTSRWHLHFLICR